VTIYHNFDGTQHHSTASVSQELTNATYPGEDVAIQTDRMATYFTIKLDLLHEGNKFMLVTVVRFSYPNGSTFDIKVETANIALVEKKHLS
jgi:hypothetical protein